MCEIPLPLSWPGCCQPLEVFLVGDSAELLVGFVQRASFLVMFVQKKICFHLYVNGLCCGSAAALAA